MQETDESKIIQRILGTSSHFHDALPMQGCLDRDDL